VLIPLFVIRYRPFSAFQLSRISALLRFAPVGFPAYNIRLAHYSLRYRAGVQHFLQSPAIWPFEMAWKINSNSLPWREDLLKGIMYSRGAKKNRVKMATLF